MESDPVRSTVSLLRTVLHLLENDPALHYGSETVLEFRRATLALIAEIETDHSAKPVQREPANFDAAVQAIRDHR